MDIPKGTTVAVADGEKLNLFLNSGNAADPRLTPMGKESVGTDNKGAGARHLSSSANPDDGQAEEDSFAAGIADVLNQKVLSGHIADLIIVAAPRTLGELRKHYHEKLSAVLVGEIAKDLTGHSIQDIEKLVAAA